MKNHAKFTSNLAKTVIKLSKLIDFGWKSV